MDNEISDDLLKTPKVVNMEYQLVSPHSHRRNLAKRSVQTLKTHFKAELTNFDPEFLLTGLDSLVEQANITLNLLRIARSDPKISSYA